MQAGSASLAHWFDEERCSLQSRLDTLEDPTYLDARGRVLHERTAAAVKVQSVMRGFLLRQRFFQQLEREAMQLSYEVSTEAQLRWVRGAAAYATRRERRRRQPTRRRRWRRAGRPPALPPPAQAASASGRGA